MLLSAVLLAAAVQAAPPRDQIVSGLPSYRASMKEVVETVEARAACRNRGFELAVNSATTTPAKVKALGDLPPANHTLTVLRSIEGCPVSSTIRFNVDLPAGR